MCVVKRALLIRTRIKSSVSREPYSYASASLPTATATQRPTCVVKNSPMHTYTSQNSPVTSALFILLRPLASATATQNVRPLYLCCQKSRVCTQKSHVDTQTSPVESCHALSRALFIHERPFAATITTERPAALCVLSKEPRVYCHTPQIPICMQTIPDTRALCIVPTPSRHSHTTPAYLMYVVKRALFTRKRVKGALFTRLQPPRHRHCHTTPAFAMCVVKRALFTRKRALLKEPSLPTYALLPPPLPHNAHPLYVCCEKGPIYTQKNQKSPYTRALLTHLRPLATATATQSQPAVCVLPKGLFSYMYASCVAKRVRTTHMSTASYSEFLTVSSTVL